MTKVQTLKIFCSIQITERIIQRLLGTTEDTILKIIALKMKSVTYILNLDLAKSDFARSKKLTFDGQCVSW